MKTKNKLCFRVEIHSGKRTLLDVAVGRCEINDSKKRIGKCLYKSEDIERFIADVLYKELLKVSKK